MDIQPNVVAVFVWALVIIGIATMLVLWITKQWPDGDDFPDV